MKEIYEEMKTLRFGLSKHGDNSNVSKNRGHKLFEDEVKKSFEKVESEKIYQNQNFKELNTKIIDYSEKLNLLYDKWFGSNLYSRFDIIQIQKPYYIKLSQKYHFDKFSNGSNTISEAFLLKDSPNGNDAIKFHWNQLKSALFSKINNINYSSKEFHQHIDEDRTDKSFNLINYKKSFLDLFKLANFWLKPLFTGELSIRTTKNNKIIEDFLKEEQLIQDCFILGNEVSEYFNQLGNNIELARVSLNPYTILKNSHDYINGESGIKNKELKELKLKEIFTLYKEDKTLEKYKINSIFYKDINRKDFIKHISKISFNKNYVPFGDYLEKIKSEFKDFNFSSVLCTQIIKPKAVWNDLQNDLIELLDKDRKNSYQLREFFKEFGKPLNIAFEISEKNKNNEIIRKDFLFDYPIKLAFDYAWENLSLYHSKLLDAEAFEFDACEEFLEVFQYNKESEGDFFNDEKYNEAFYLYSQLSAIKILIARLKEHKKKDIIYKDESQDDISKLRESINNLDYFGDENYFNKKEEKEEANKIKKFLKTTTEWVNIFETQEFYKLNDIKSDFIKSRKEFGLIRGNQKNKIKGYENIMSFNKTLTTEFGRKLASIRDALKAQYDIEKNNSQGVIVTEGKNKYILIKNIFPEKGKIIKDNIFSELYNHEVKSGIKLQFISSLTGQTLHKMLSHQKSYSDFHSYKKPYFEVTLNNGRKRNDFKKYFEQNTFKNEDTKKSKEALNYIKSCITKSRMSKNQDWNTKFNWEKDLEECKTYKDIEKVCDIKGYYLEEKYISEDNIKILVDNGDCLLFPIVNQDYSSQNNQKAFTSNKNQFTKDFEEALRFKEDSEGFRLHPEFSLFYKFPSILPDKNSTLEELKNNHKIKILNRHMRFQILGNFSVEKKTTIKDKGNFISRKEKLNIIRNKDEYKKLVENFNQDINSRILEKQEDKKNKLEYFYGLDRGIKELATLCVLDKQNEIQDFIVFNKEKIEDKVLSRLSETGDKTKKVYRYSKTKDGEHFQKKSILDLTNIKVETWHCADTQHPNSEFLIEAFKEIKLNPEYKKIMESMGHDFSDKDNTSFKILVKYPEAEGSTALKLRMKHYQRLLAYSCSEGEYRKYLYENCGKLVFEDIQEYSKLEGDTEKKLEIIRILFGLKGDFSYDKNEFFKELQTNKLKINEVIKKVGRKRLVLLFEPILEQLFEWFKEYDGENEEIREDKYKNNEFKVKFAELDDLDNLKRGIVANMVGTINFLMKTKPGVIILEDLAIENKKREGQHGLTGQGYEVTSDQESIHLSYVGTETYRYLEKMLVRKFERQGLTPPFADLDSLNKILLEINGKQFKNKKQFGIFYYIPAEGTSKTCPCCGGKAKRNGAPDNKNYFIRDRIRCKNDEKNCGFDTYYNDNTRNEFYNPSKISEIAKRFGNISEKSLQKIHTGDWNAGYIITNQIQKIFFKEIKSDR